MINNLATCVDDLIGSLLVILERDHHQMENDQSTGRRAGPHMTTHRLPVRSKAFPNKAGLPTEPNIQTKEHLQLQFPGSHNGVIWMHKAQC